MADVLIYSSAIITKLASDTIALMIEATADRRNFYRLRRLDYAAKFKAIFACYVKLETLFPERNMLEVFAAPGEFRRITQQVGAVQREELFAHLLDLMYFWFYKSTSHQVFKSLIAKMSPQERQVLNAIHEGFFKSNPEEAEEIIRKFLGSHSTKCLEFYRANFKPYFKSMQKFFPGLATE